MPFHYRALASLWVIIFGLSTLSGSGTIVGPDVALLVLGGIVTPAVLLTAATGGTVRRRSSGTHGSLWPMREI